MSANKRGRPSDSDNCNDYRIIHWTGHQFQRQVQKPHELIPSHQQKKRDRAIQTHMDTERRQKIFPRAMESDQKM